MKPSSNIRGFTFTSVMVTVILVGVLGLICYSLLNIGTILGAKNTALNTAHQQARTAMLQMIQDLHSAISLPTLVDVNGNSVSGAGPAAGISFQLWSIGPLQIGADAATSQNKVTVQVPSGTQMPVVGQRLIVPTHQIEDDITAVSAGSGTNVNLTLAHNLPAAITGTQPPTSYNIIAFVTDRCSYTVANSALKWQGPTVRKSFSIMGNDITNPTPFSTPNTPAGALYYRFVAAIDLSTADLNYNNRGFKSANILLNGQVPMRARLTTYQ